MGGPGEVTAGGYIQVFAGTCFQCLSMEEVAGCLNLFLIVEHDVDAAAFAWVEFHLPGVFPLP